jgi:hypothetical protein
MFSKIIYMLFNLYKGEFEYEFDYTYTKILNHFLPDHENKIKKPINPEIKKQKPYMDIIQKLEVDSRNKLYEEFFKMEKQIEDLKLKDDARIQFNKQKQLQKEQRIKDIEKENEFLKKQNEELRKKMELLTLK